MSKHCSKPLFNYWSAPAGPQAPEKTTVPAQGHITVLGATWVWQTAQGGDLNHSRTMGNLSAEPVRAGPRCNLSWEALVLLKAVCSFRADSTAHVVHPAFS